MGAEPETSVMFVAGDVMIHHDLLVFIYVLVICACYIMYVRSIFVKER